MLEAGEIVSVLAKLKRDTLNETMHFISNPEHDVSIANGSDVKPSRIQRVPPWRVSSRA